LIKSTPGQKAQSYKYGQRQSQKPCTDINEDKSYLELYTNHNNLSKLTSFNTAQKRPSHAALWCKYEKN